MIDKKALACYFPTTVILVDDDPAYLENVVSSLDKKLAIYKVFSDPVEALEYLNNRHQRDPFIERCISQEDDPDLGHRNIDMSLFPIIDEIYNPKRFKEVSIVIADQVMPELKGLDFLKQIQDKTIKKVLLTGMTTEQEAVRAFNNDIIDRFIDKDTENLYKSLEALIKELCYDRFKDMTSIIVDNLAYPREGYEPSPLIDPVFLDFFNNLIKEKNIVEYYLYDDNGSFVFFDFNGNPSFLVVKVDDEMKGDFLMADDLDEEISLDVLKGLENRSLIVKTFTPKEYRMSPAEWEKRGMLYPAKTLQGKEQLYYYAYIDKSDAHEIDKAKFISFKDYLTKK